MTKFLALQHTYGGIEVALFSDNILVEKIFEDKKRASKYLIAVMDSLLKRHDCRLDDLSFIAANQGPGPFTTLRVVIATVNGIAFATKKPIIGVDGLEAILQEYGDSHCLMTIALLDAFSKDVYFCIQHVNNLYVEKGYQNISVFLSQIKELVGNNKVQFIGNGSEKYKDLILEAYKDQVVFPDPVPLSCTIERIGLMAFEKWKKTEGFTDQLLPLYLKTMEIKKKSPSTF